MKIPEIIPAQKVSFLVSDFDTMVGAKRDDLQEIWGGFLYFFQNIFANTWSTLAFIGT